MIIWYNWIDDLLGIFYFEYEFIDIGYGMIMFVKKVFNIIVDVELV